MVDTVRFSMGSTVSFIAGKLSFWVLMGLFRIEGVVVAGLCESLL